jgi:ribosomal protein L35
MGKKKKKNKSSAKKRFARTGTGKLRFKQNKHHLRTGKSTRWKNRVNKKKEVENSDRHRITKLID